MTDEPPVRHGARSRTRRVLAVALFALALAGCLTAVVVALVAGLSFSAAVNAYTVTDGAMALAFPVSGVLLAWHRPGNPIGWLFLAAGLGMASTAVSGPLLALGAQRGWSQGVLRALDTVGAYGWPWTIALFLPLALILFPDGRLPGRRWRWLIWATLADTLPFLASLGSPNPQTIGHRRVGIYLAPPHFHQLGLVWTLANVLWAVIFAGAIASLAVRYRRGRDTERRQLLWLLLVGLVLVPWVGVIWGIFNAGPILGLLALSLIPVAVTVAILRHQLLDIRVVVSRALLYGLLTAAAIGAYAGLVALLDLMVRSRVSFGVAVVASIIVAFCFNPARVWLQRLIDRALYGDRRDPVRAVSRVGERLAGTGAAGAGLSGVLEALCDSLRLPFAAVHFSSGEIAAHGTAPELRHAIGLSYDGATVGELVVGLRSGQYRLSPPDVAVLQLLAGPLAVAAHATALSDALQESRSGIVAAREEERRRLRRDLHDGLGPVLTGIAFKADAARNTLKDADAAAGPARDLLAGLRADTTAAIADIRQLVYGLRPPALDDLGLVGSLREQSARLALRPDGGGVAVSLDAPASLPALPAAVEVAAYRIVIEAMTNAVRHSGASRIEVTLALTGGAGLSIEVRDDGTGPPAGWQPGVGVTSMRERAAELGGSCRFGPGPDGGGEVIARLPVPDRLSPPRPGELTATPTEVSA
ncbi:MAG TPA: histidine kinase [Streptosporangiaceae bacterium]|nr:histidine kinase [Streptosporangiaceae bacterium]